MTAASKDRWKHQEDSSDDEKAANTGGFTSYNRKAPPTANTDHATEPAALASGYEEFTHTQNGYGRGPDAYGSLDVKCGPLLNFKGISSALAESRLWQGSVLLVTTPAERQPELRLRCLGPIGHGANGAFYGESANSYSNGHGSGYSQYTGDNMSNGAQSQLPTYVGVKLYADPLNVFWRFKIDVPLQAHEARWEYSIENMRHLSGVSPRSGSTRTFVVPAASQSMRIMFHSCNGFSVGTNVDAWSGPALWNDVIRVHEKKPFHVMIGGGDQIYNDYVRSEGPLRPWTNIANPKRRRDFPFNEELRAECDEYYCNNYVDWFSQEPFASANGQIPQINIWDDHGEKFHCSKSTDVLIRTNQISLTASALIRTTL